METPTAEIGDRSALSAHRRVPSELWEIIFSTLCHPYSFRIDCDHDMLEDDDDIIIETPALALSHVCSRWRKIMKDSPSLWSSISILITEFVFDPSEPLQMHFTNAQDCPLDIRIVRLEGESFHLVGSEISTWKIISRHFSRCRRLSLRLLSQSDLSVHTDISFPHLEFLSEEAFPGKRLYGLWRAIQHRAPRLTNVDVEGIHISLPFSQLKSLDLRTTPDDDMTLLHEALPTCRRLEELSLRGLDDTDGVPMNLSHIQLPKSLRKLRICDEGFPIRPDNDVLSTFLHLVTIPSLTCFELQCDDWPPLLPILAERCPLLERVSLTIRSPSTTDFSSHPLFSFLQALSQLKHVELHIGTPDSSSSSPVENNLADPSDLGDKFLEGVLSNLEAEGTFPKLEYLSIHLLDFTPKSEVMERVLQGVFQRYSSPLVTALQEFRLFRDRKLVRHGEPKCVRTPALTERLRQLQQDFGVRVVIEDRTSISRPPPAWGGRTGHDMYADSPALIHV